MTIDTSLESIAALRALSFVILPEDAFLQDVRAGNRRDFQRDTATVIRTRHAYEAARDAMGETYQEALGALEAEEDELNITEAGSCSYLVDVIRQVVGSLFRGLAGPSLAERREMIGNRRVTLNMLHQSDPEILFERWGQHMDNDLRFSELMTYLEYKEAWENYYIARYGYNPLL